MVIVDKFGMVDSAKPSQFHIYCGSATRCIWLQQVWIDRAFRELSNSVIFVDFGLVLVEASGVLKYRV